MLLSLYRTSSVSRCSAAPCQASQGEDVHVGAGKCISILMIAVPFRMASQRPPLDVERESGRGGSRACATRGPTKTESRIGVEQAGVGMAGWLRGVRPIGDWSSGRMTLGRPPCTPVIPLCFRGPEGVGWWCGYSVRASPFTVGSRCTRGASARSRPQTPARHTQVKQTHSGKTGRSIALEIVLLGPLHRQPAPLSPASASGRRAAASAG